jgi:NAD kinase
VPVAEITTESFESVSFNYYVACLWQKPPYRALKVSLVIIMLRACGRDHNIETRVLQRWDFTTEALDWADAVFTAGGDGTYLLASTRYNKSMKPLIGLNTDPDKSVHFDFDFDFMVSHCFRKAIPCKYLFSFLSVLIIGTDFGE